MNIKQTTVGGTFALESSEENALINYIQYMGERGFHLTRKAVKKLLVDVVKTSSRSPRINVEKGPSNKWMKRFLKRHPEVSLRTPQPLEKDRSTVSQGQIDQFYELLDQTLVKLGIKDHPSRNFNFVETGFSGKEHGKQKIKIIVRSFGSSKNTKLEDGPYCTISGIEPSSVTLYKTGSESQTFCCNFKNLHLCSLNQRLKFPKGPNNQNTVQKMILNI